MCIFHFYCCVFLVFVLPSGVIKNDDNALSQLQRSEVICELLFLLLYSTGRTVIMLSDLLLSAIAKFLVNVCFSVFDRLTIFYDVCVSIAYISYIYCCNVCPSDDG